MSSVVKFTRKKVQNIPDLIKSMIGEVESISEAEKKLAVEMSELAELYEGEFDEDMLSVSFDGKESSITVYASLDESNVYRYQALYETSKPHHYTAGNLEDSFLKALESIKQKTEM